MDIFKFNTLKYFIFQEKPTEEVSVEAEVIIQTVVLENLMFWGFFIIVYIEDSRRFSPF